METIQMLVPSDFQLLASPPGGCVLTRNLVPSGNHEPISQSTQAFLSSSACGTVRVSPLSMSLMCIPSLSVYARYLPSGEIVPVFTVLSRELLVSCLSFNSNGGFLAADWRLAYQRATPAMNSRTTTAAAISRHRAGCFGSISRFKTSRSVRISEAD